MPELPEVETVRLGLLPVMEGHVLTQVETRRGDLRLPFPQGFAARMRGRKVKALRRRAKYLLADLDSGETLVIHLGMSGRMSVYAEGKARPNCQFAVTLEPSLLGTGGGIVYAAAQHPDDHYLCLNGDSATFVSLKPAQDWLKSDPGLDGVIIAKQLDDAGRYGSLDIGPDGLLKGFREKQAGAGWINAGIYLLRAPLLAMEPKAMSIEFDCFPRWLADGARIGVLAAKADFLDIGTPETLAKATAFIEANRASLTDPAKLVPVQHCV
jgi:NDP-sugar pyrophosphorylase family protein